VRLRLRLRPPLMGEPWLMSGERLRCRPTGVCRLRLRLRLPLMGESWLLSGEGTECLERLRGKLKEIAGEWVMSQDLGP
jgi:hypothetical protein